MGTRGRRTHAEEPEAPPASRVRSTRLPWPRSDGSTPLGVDLARHHTDVHKIAWKWFQVLDMPMEDLIQEIHLAIHRRNFTRSAFDPRLCSLGHYVYIIGLNVCRNLIAARKTKGRIPEGLLDSFHNGDGDAKGDAHAAYTPVVQPDHERTLDILGATDLDVCKVLVGKVRCGHDSTRCWLDMGMQGAWAIRSVCAEHEATIPAGKVIMAPAEMAHLLASVVS